MSNVVVNPFVLEAAGGDPTITFTWDAENTTGELPVGASFARASVKQEFDGTDYTELSSGTIPENSAAVGSGAQGFNPEPATTNEVDDNDMTSGSWSSDRLTATDDGVNSLGLNQFTLDAGVLTGSHRIFISADTGSTGSGYFTLKEGNHNFCTVSRGAQAGQDYAVFDLNLGTVTQEGGGITSSFVELIDDGWYRCGIITTDTSQILLTAISPNGTPGGREPNFTGANETILCCHQQYVDDDFNTSPVLTSGSVQSRAADVLDTGVAITTEFSALLDVTLPDAVVSGETITLLGPDTTAEDILRVDDSFNVIMDDGGTPVTIGTSSSGSRIKVAYGRDAGDRSASLDGATAVDGDAPDAGHVGENFELGSRAGINQSRCIHHLTTLFDVKKSDAELEALAT